MKNIMAVASALPGAMPTDVFGRGHVVFVGQPAHADMGMAPNSKGGFGLKNRGFLPSPE